MPSLAIFPITQRERPTVRALLDAAGLPVTDLDHVDLYVARAGQRIIGAIGLERYGRRGLLRSLVVDPAERRHGIGGQLVDRLEAIAAAAGVDEFVLLTTTADGFFERRGYRRIDRRSVSGPILESAEFRSLCPESAVCLAKSLREGSQR
jgi:amino-acid N-acetyltransferase